MNTNYLFPHQLKRIGWFLFIPGIILGIIYLSDHFEFEFLDITVLSIAQNTLFASGTDYFSLMNNNIFDEIIGLLLISGALFIAFSKEKSEDEFIAKIRLESLVWATYVNFLILILAIIFIYDMAFFWVLVFNMFTILIFFVIRFNWALIKSKKQIQDEE